MKLSTKFAVLLLAVTILLSGVVYGGLELYKENAVEGERDAVSQAAAMTANHVDQVVAADRGALRHLGAYPPYGTDGRLRLDAILEQPRFVGVQVVGPNGTVLRVRGETASVPFAEEGADVSDRAYARRALAGETSVTDPIYRNGSGRYLAVVAAPLEDTGGALVVATELGARGVLGDANTTTQLVRIEEATGVPRSPFETPIEASATVESTQWTVTVSRSRAALNQQIRHLALVQGFGVLVVLLCVVAFGLWEYNENLEQIERLLNGFAALARGDYDYSLGLTASHEWNQITRGFDLMAEGLAAREAVLRERRQRLSVLSRVLRHNLRNDMTVILGRAQRIRSNASDPALRADAEAVIETGRGLAALSDKAQLIQKTLDIAEDGPLSQDLVEHVRDVVADLREEYPQVTIETRLPDEAPVLAISMLPTAVENVVENACKHNEGDEKRVAIEIEETDERFRLIVADDGSGIPTQEYTVLGTESYETSLEHTSGLGLWLVYWIVEKSSGSLSFEESAWGGTAVTIELERADD